MAKANVSARELRDRVIGRKNAAGSLSLSPDELADEFYRFMSERIRMEIPSFNRLNSHYAFSRTYHQGADGTLHLLVSVNKQQLYRPAFTGFDNRPTGSGAYDIIGLFVRGYKQTDKKVFGYWAGHGAGIYTNPAYKLPSPFIARAAADFERIHAEQGIKVKITNANWL